MRPTFLSRSFWRTPSIGMTLLSGVAVGLAAALLHSTSTSIALDRCWYDAALRFAARRDSRPAEVLLITASPAELANAHLLQQLVRKARQLEARQLVVTVTADETSDAFRESVAGDTFVVMGAGPLAATAGGPPNGSPSATDLAAAQTVASSPRIMPPPAEDGTCRQHWAQIQTHGQTIASLEFEAARRVVPAEWLPKTAAFNAYFRGGAQSLPSMSLSRALAGDLLHELAQGRSVLLGLDRSSTDFGVVTPTTAAGETMSVLEFRGHALNTLLNGQAIVTLPGAARALLLLAAGIVGAVVTRRDRVRWSLLLTVALLLLQAVAAYTLLATWHYWLPVADLLLVQLGCLCAVSLTRLRQLEGLLGHWTSHALVTMPQQATAPAAPVSPDDWKRLMECMHQSLGLRRLMVVKCLRRGALAELVGIGCGMDDITADGIGRHRWPFRQASEASRAVSFADEQAFLRGGSDECQYLAALWVGDTLFGFLALGIDASRATPAFEAQLKDHVTQLTELLADRQRMILIRTNAPSPEQGMEQSLQLAKRRLQHLKTAADQCAVPMAVFDLFGNPAVVNQSMTRLLDVRPSSARASTSAELISELAGCDLDQAHEVLRRVVSEGLRETLPTHQLDTSKIYLLQVRRWFGPASASYEASIQGVICELVDRTDYVETCQLKNHLTTELGNLLRNDLMGIGLAATLLQESDVEADERQEICGLVQTKVEASMAALEECCKYLSRDTSGGDDCIPVAPYAALTDATASIQPTADQQRVTIRMTTPVVSSQVFAVPKRLTQVFRACFDLLIYDAQSDSEIQVAVEQSGTEVRFVLSNQGFGTAGKLLVQRPGGPVKKRALPYQRFQDAMQRVAEWGGRIDVSEATTGGTSIRLALRRFGRSEATVECAATA